MRKKEEEEKEGERGKLYGPSLCCALAQIPMGLFVSLSNCLTNRMRIIGSAPLGVSPIATYGVLGPLWHSLWGLQDVTVLYWSCSYNHPLGSYMGTLSDCFSCALCLPIFLDPYTALWRGNRLFIPTGEKRDSRPMRLKQQLES